MADVTPFVIWFGVLLAVNMQTSFMHPPFGFAPLYLRSVAPKKPYLDRITGRLTAPVTTGQIYRGAIPFVGIQLVMVALVMAVPEPGRASRKVKPVPPRSPNASKRHGAKRRTSVHGNLDLLLPGTPPDHRWSA